MLQCRVDLHQLYPVFGRIIRIARHSAWCRRSLMARVGCHVRQSPAGGACNDLRRRGSDFLLGFRRSRKGRTRRAAWSPGDSGACAMAQTAGQDLQASITFEGEVNMRIEHTRFAVLASAFSLTAFLVTPTVAEAAKARAAGGRDAAVSKCIAEAQASAPGILTPGDAERARRVAVYKNCMVQAGYRP